MSIRVMALVWKIHLTSVEKIILLCYADRAHDNGTSVFPSKRSVAERCELNLRTVFKATKKLVESGYLIKVGWSKYHTVNYKINISQLEKEAKNEINDGLHSDMSMVVNQSNGGEQPPKSSLTINKTSYKRLNKTMTGLKEKYHPQYDEEIQKAISAKRI